MESGLLLIVFGIAGAAMFFVFIWLMTAGLRKSAGQRMREQEEIRQAELRRARGEQK